MEWHALVGGNIRRLREDRRWNIEELAHAAGMDSGYLGKVERGQRNPSLKKLLAIAAALEVEPAELFARKI